MSYWVAGAVVVGSIVSAKSASDASKKAAGASSAATEAQIAEQRRQYDLNRQDIEPWRVTGRNALGAYSNRLGLPEYVPSSTPLRKNNAAPGGQGGKDNTIRDRLLFNHGLPKPRDLGLPDPLADLGLPGVHEVPFLSKLF